MDEKNVTFKFNYKGDMQIIAITEVRFHLMREGDKWLKAVHVPAFDLDKALGEDYFEDAAMAELTDEQADKVREFFTPDWFFEE